MARVRLCRIFGGLGSGRLRVKMTRSEIRMVEVEFVPYLRAARWTGVGRQTVLGKGEIEVEAVG